MFVGDWKCRMNLRPAAFLDRDGVINADRGYIYRREDFEFLPGVFDAVRELRGSDLFLLL